MFSSLLNFDKIKLASTKYSKDPTINYQYGTAGFRCSHELLDCVVFRVGILAAFRSKYLKGKTIGIMITASHNPEKDNGVKIVDPMGEMMASEWESLASELANVNSDSVASKCSKLLADLKIDHAQPARVVFARDTRPSGSRLSRALIDGVQCVDAAFTDFGEMTTPQLHYIVRCLNTQKDKIPYGVPTEEGYYSKMITAFDKILADNATLTSAIVVDCANGIGALKMERVQALLPKFNFKLINTDTRKSGVLNHLCGADFVKVEQKPPSGLSSDLKNERCASLDGDADRVVYYYTNANDKFILFDGDKIAALIAAFIKEMMVEIPNLMKEISVGVVQTAYANGNSTKYFENMGIPVVCAETGVKNLHHEAENFDIGIYFEANGHGTVLFSSKYTEVLRKYQGKKQSEILLTFPDLINQTVGDAISDMLTVEAILSIRGWTIDDWANNTYTDLPNRQLKVKVKDRQQFKTTDAERKLVSPNGLQNIIDSLVQKYSNGRAFVRPSGTEDVVRVYAEASTREDADNLANAIADEVKKFVGV